MNALDRAYRLTNQALGALHAPVTSENFPEAEAEAEGFLKQLLETIIRILEQGVVFPPGEKELLFFIVRTTDDTKLLLRDTADLFGATRQMIYWASGHMRDKLIAAVKPQPIAQSIPPADLTEEPPWDIDEFAKLYRQTEQRRAIDNFITTMLKFQQSCRRVLQAGGVSSLEKQVMAPPPPPVPPRWWARPWRALCWLRRQGRRFINWLQS